MRKRPWLAPLRGLLLVFCAVGAFGILTGAFLGRREEPLPQVTPLVMQIQQLGKLHTVRYNMHDILDHERSIQPEGWVAALPGADTLYRNLTRNRVLVVAEGGVEAGVDLSAVTPADVTRVATADGIKLRVRLPRATLYTPDVKVRVVNSRPGIFWKNENIVPEATAEVQRRFVESARASEILAEAESNAVKVLSNMTRLAGNDAVEFYF